MPWWSCSLGYDYKSEPRKGWFVVNDREAEVVLKMYAWLVEDGMSSYAIAKRLWQENILTKGDYSDVVHKKGGRGEWSPTTVRRIISNSVYKGIWYYGKTRRKKVKGKKKQVPVPKSEWIAVPVPAIVDEALWERAQKRLAKNKQYAKRNAKRNYLLRSIVFCPCGRRWTGLYKNHLKRAYYRCPSNEAETWRHRCDNRFSIRQKVLEKAVWNQVTDFLLEPENLISEIARRREETEAETILANERLQSINNVIANVDHKLGNLLDQVLVNGFAQSVIDQKKKELMTQREELEAEADRINSMLEAETITPQQEMELTELSKMVGESLQDLDFDNKRRLLELLDIRIDVISPTKIKLSGIISEGLFVDTLQA